MESPAEPDNSMTKKLYRKPHHHGRTVVSNTFE